MRRRGLAGSMPVVTTQEVMPKSASTRISHLRAPEEKVIASSCAKLDFLQFFRLKFVQNRKLLRLEVLKNGSGQICNCLFGEANHFCFEQNLVQRCRIY